MKKLTISLSRLGITGVLQDAPYAKEDGGPALRQVTRKS
jgi:hypothetical protein